MACVFVCRWMNSTRSLSFSSCKPWTPRIPTEPSSLKDLTSRGNFRRRGPPHLAVHREDGEARHVDTMIGENLFRERLVFRKGQAARVASRVGKLHQFQIADDVLVEHGLAVKLFDEIEGDVRLVFFITWRRTSVSSKRPTGCTSWPSSLSVVATSYSVRQRRVLFRRRLQGASRAGRGRAGRAGRRGASLAASSS